MLARTLLPAWPPFPTARKLRREQCTPRTARRGGGYYSGDWRASRGMTGFVGGAGRCRWGVFARLDEAREEGQFVPNFTETLTWLWEGNFLPLPSLGGRRGVGEGEVGSTFPFVSCAAFLEHEFSQRGWRPCHRSLCSACIYLMDKYLPSLPCARCLEHGDEEG